MTSLFNTETTVKTFQNPQAYLDSYNVSAGVQKFLARQHELFIGNVWKPASDGGTVPVIEPATGQQVSTLANATVGDLEEAVSAARSAFESGEWATQTPLARERMIHRLADLIEENFHELATLESIDVGKPLSEAEMDIQGTIDTYRYFAGWATKITGRSGEPAGLEGNYVAYTRKEPVGVIGVIVPWNFPLQTLAWKLGAALAVGCTTVVKPPEVTSLTTLRFAELALEAGIPAGVINILTGKGSTVGAALASHKGIDKVTFTGSTKTGMSVGHAALENMTRMTLELGGKSAVLVFDDCDLDKAVEEVAFGIFFNAGQICDAGSRLYVQDSIYDEFMDKLVANARSWKLGVGLDPETMIGPLVSDAQYRSVTAMIKTGVEEGATLLCGGPIDDGITNYVAPSIFGDCTNKMTVVREEIFGPVLVAQRFSTQEEALALANDSEYGLAATIYSQSLNRVHQLSKSLKAGSVYVNAQSSIDPAMPFGGYKKSGFGRDLGAEQLDYVTETKTVWITLP
ncbi:aldehyde dehydrogenase family protein [Glutamicibacter sp. NPDC087673]|uniref:aldehyde dehydrogenase family protein n=1 Tax=Glutamicibacter sp. NPDC087673 TaxID=3363997 RepID=UPI0037F2B65D